MTLMFDEPVGNGTSRKQCDQSDRVVVDLIIVSYTAIVVLTIITFLVRLWTSRQRKLDFTISNWTVFLVIIVVAALRLLRPHKLFFFNSKGELPGLLPVVLSMTVFTLLFYHVCLILRIIHMTYQPLLDNLNGRRDWCPWGWWCRMCTLTFDALLVVLIFYGIVMWIFVVVLLWKDKIKSLFAVLSIAALLASLSYAIAIFKLFHHLKHLTAIRNANTAGLFLQRDRQRADPPSVTEQAPRAEDASLSPERDQSTLEAPQQGVEESDIPAKSQPGSWQLGFRMNSTFSGGPFCVGSLSAGTAAWCYSVGSAPTCCSSVVTQGDQLVQGGAGHHAQLMRELPLVLQGLQAMLCMSVPILLSFICRVALFSFVIFPEKRTCPEEMVLVVVYLVVGEVVPIVTLLFLYLNPGVQAIAPSIRRRMMRLAGAPAHFSETRRVHSTTSLRSRGPDDLEIPLESFVSLES